MPEDIANGLEGVEKPNEGSVGAAEREHNIR